MKGGEPSRPPSAGFQAHLMPNCIDGSKDRRARAPAMSRTRENTVLRAPASLPAHRPAGSCLSAAPHPRVDGAPAAPAPGLLVVKHSGHTGVSASELLAQTLRLQRHLPRFQPILPPRSPAGEERGTRSHPFISFALQQRLRFCRSDPAHTRLMLRKQ